MKTHVSSLELHYLIKELKEIEGCVVNKVFQKEEDFLLDLHMPGEGKKQLRINLPGLTYLTKYKPEFPKKPPEFCMLLRKHVSSMYVEKIRQKGFDRIVEITLERGDTKRLLILELFSKGNLILCKEDYEIIVPLKGQTWQARTIEAGTKYEYPPEQVDTKEVSFQEFWHQLEESDLDTVVKALAVDFGLGGTYAEEVMARTEVDKDAEAETLPKEETREVYEALQEILNEKVKANAVDDEVYPFEMQSVEGEKESYESFNEAVDEVVSRTLVETEAEKKKELKQERLDKVKNVIEDQRQNIKKLQGDVKDNKKKGELIYENYQEINRLLRQIRQDSEEMSWDEIKEKYESLDYVEQLNEKEKRVIIEVN